jgi:hypothetical protein
VVAKRRRAHARDRCAYRAGLTPRGADTSDA